MQIAKRSVTVVFAWRARMNRQFLNAFYAGIHKRSSRDASLPKSPIVQYVGHCYSALEKLLCSYPL